jgi:5'-3' exonuclease
MAKTFLIDSSIFIFRSYFSMPDNWVSESGIGTGAVYGYCQFLLSLIDQQQPHTMACCYDESLTTCFRNQVYPDYKANRELPDEALAFQLAAAREASELMGIASLSSSIYEADDLIGSLLNNINSARPNPEQAPVAIASRDKDLGQLILNAHDHLWESPEKRAFAQDILAKFGVNPAQIPDYLALVGDTSDNIPGVPGVGPKTAALLLTEYHDIEGLFANLANIERLSFRGAKQMAAKLELHLEQIALAKLLATIATDAPLPSEARDLSLGAPNWSALEQFCTAMGFPRVYARMEKVLGR